MIRLFIVIFALAVATSAQAMSPAPLNQPDSMVTQVREACGAGYHMVNGSCVRTAARRNAATGVRLVCEQWVVVALNECPACLMSCAAQRAGR